MFFIQFYLHLVVISQILTISTRIETIKYFHFGTQYTKSNIAKSKHENITTNIVIFEF